jgi:hypothetical protein
MSDIQKFTVPAAAGRQEFALYAIKENINYFIKTALTPDADAGTSNKQVIVKAHSRRQGPGDARDINVAGSNREVLIDPTRKSGTALPGRSIVLVADAGLPGEERRQFTLSGRWIDFHAWLTGIAATEIYAYNHRGTRYTIEAAGTTP